ncbi:MAG: sensor histidine kinase [Oscillospiraceae bacterium]|nr:sensor histidine kinase [Oscillospiraceae bacterium]
MKKSPVLLPVILLFLILAVFIVFMCLPLGQTRVNAERGTLDLRAEDLGKSVYLLTGEWEIYEESLLTPQEIAALPAQRDPQLLNVPHNWGGDADYLNTYATYRITILTGDTRQLMLYMPEIYTAYKLYINGEFVESAGVVADNPDDGEPSFESVLIPVKARSGAVEVVIQASNYHWMRPHMNNIIKLAESESMYSWVYRTRSLYIIAMGFILASAFYHLSLYMMRRRMTVYLLFTLLCFMCFWRLALETDGLSDFAGWFSTTSGILDARIFLVLFFLTATFVGMFSLYVFDREWITGKKLWMVAYCVGGIAAFSLLPTNVAWITPVFAVAAAIPISVALYKALRSRVLRESKVMWLYIVALVLYLVVGFFAKYFADHLLYMTPVINNMYMVMTQSVILARQFAEIHSSEQALSEKNELLDRLNLIKNEFYHNMSHDFKTPLTAISASILDVEDMLDYEVDKDIIRSNMKNAQHEVMYLARIVDNAMKYAVLHDNTQDMEPLDLAMLLREGAESHRALLQRQGNSLVVDVPASLPRVFGSTDMILQVLSNLVSNANRYTRNGEISISASAEGALDNADAQLVIVTVRDNGTGVNPDILPQAFKRGVSEGGTGLGLAISMSAIEAHGGTIWIESDYGRGTAVHFTLPVYM